MSSDTGIYVLKMKDQWRVIERSAIDDLYWDWAGMTLTDQLNWLEVYASYHNAFTFDTEEEACVHACRLSSQIYTEYGVNLIDVSRYTWEDIRNMAREQLPKDRKAIEESPKKWVKYYISTLDELEQELGANAERLPG